MQDPKISTESIVGMGGSYRKWVESEGIPLVESFFVEDIATVPLEPWKRTGGLGMRYLALCWGSQKYHEMWGEGRGKADVDVKLGGNQIEYENEDPIVRKMFSQACAKAGVTNLMEAHYPAA